MAEPATIPTQMEQWAGIRLAHEAVMLGDAAAVLRQSRQCVKDHAAVHVIGNAAQEPDEMIHVGNVYQQPKPSLGPLASIAIGAGLLATGIGIPVGAWMLAGGAKDVVVPPVVEKPIEQPQEPPSERPAVNVGGLELRLGK